MGRFERGLAKVEQERADAGQPFIGCPADPPCTRPCGDCVVIFEADLWLDELVAMDGLS